MNPTTVLIAPPRRYRKRSDAPVASLPPVPAAPLLVSAVYDPANVRLTMVFDRAVQFDNYDGTAINVIDPIHNFDFYWGLNSHTLINPTTVRIQLNGMYNPVGDVVTLRATANVGIVAVDGGIPWDGVLSLPLPYP